MSPNEILIALWSDGIAAKLSPDGNNLTVPAGRLTPGQRELLLTNKPALIEFLVAAHVTSVALIEAAMKVCDQHGDGDVARAEMRSQCLDLPTHLQADLLDHFNGKPVNLPD